MGLISGGIASIGLAAKGIVRHVAEAGLAMEGRESRLRAATGSPAAARDEIRYLREEAERLGVSFSASADNYSLFLAATRGTRLAGEQSRQIFSAVLDTVATI